MVTPEAIASEARWRELHDPLHHMRSRTAVDIFERTLTAAHPDRHLSEGERRLAARAASVALVLVDVDPASGAWRP